MLWNKEVLSFLRARKQYYTGFWLSIGHGLDPVIFLVD